MNKTPSIPWIEKVLRTSNEKEDGSLSSIQHGLRNVLAQLTSLRTFSSITAPTVELYVGTTRKKIAGNILYVRSA